MFIHEGIRNKTDSEGCGLQTFSIENRRLENYLLITILVMYDVVNISN